MARPPAFTGTLYFHSEGVDAFFEQIKGHTTPAWGPEDRGWGARELGLQDPNGYFLTFTEPRTTGRRTARSYAFPQRDRRHASRFGARQWATLNLVRPIERLSGFQLEARLD